MTTSVITLNRGRRAHLERLLEGLGRGPAPSECVVVEMGGDTAPLPDHGFPVRRIPLDQAGLPLAAARNAGRRAATGSTLIFLDVDCIPSADLVGSLDGTLVQNDGLVCCAVSYLPDGAVRDGWQAADLDAAGQLHPARVFPETGIAEAPQPGLFWSLAFAVRAATYDRLGGFDESFDGYGAEDTDLAFRAAALGVPVLFASGPRAWHQYHPAFDPPLQHFADIARNASRFRDRHGFWPMDGWLDAFARMGLLEPEWMNGLVVRRLPSAAEIEAARIPAGRPF